MLEDNTKLTGFLCNSFFWQKLSKKRFVPKLNSIDLKYSLRCIQCNDKQDRLKSFNYAQLDASNEK